VKIKCILPGDNSRIADESSLLIMDILVELEDSNLANIECQKIGYKFPGQRAACYSADLLLRQYKRVRGEKGEAFCYKDIKKVYTIVLFEKSTDNFHELPDDYIHYAKPTVDTGLEMELLQEYVFIPLDIFRETLYNKGIATPLDAWLAFLSVDDPEWIEKLILQYPEFIPLYEEVYAICKNVERVMGIFSEELKILDKNTVQLMIDEMQDEIDGMKDKMDGMKTLLGQKDEALMQKDEEIKRLKQLLEKTSPD
jgi:hypothetical protein